MTLLLRDPDAQAPAPNAETPPEAAPQPRTCPTCQSPLEPDQDWCLQCGEAQSARRSLPGRRATATVMALTTLFVGGAVAASYAALTHDPAPKPDPTQLAQAPSTATPAAPAPAATPAPAAPAPSTPAPADTTPAPAAGSGALPPASAAPATPAPASPSTGSIGSTGSTGSGSSSSGSSSSGTGTSSSGGSTGTKSTPRTSTTPAPAPPEAIALADGAATLYDPYHRDTVIGDPAKAIDGNVATSFPITAADGSTTIGAGLVVDLGKTRGIRELDLTTKTPGFKVELYATDSEELPPDVLDTRWAHIKDIPDVGTAADGGKQTVTLGSGTTKYRHVLLWFTAPPTDGLTVRVSELKLLG
jgi:hypothetical protein